MKFRGTRQQSPPEVTRRTMSVEQPHLGTSMKRSFLPFVALAALTPLFWACSSAATASPAATSQPAQTVIAATATPAAAATATLAPSSAPTALGLGGKWSGTWTDTSPDSSSGTFSLTWAQTGSTLAGTIKVSGTPCLSGGTVTGTINGGTISFGAVSGQVKVTYDGSITGAGKMGGTYSASSACASAKGNWTATQG
jgi:hypothetical protein